jgi:hypothetical protein
MTKTCTILIKNEVNAFIGGLDKADIAILNEAFTFFVDGYFFMPAYQLGRWDGKITFFDLRGNTYTKILDEVVGYIVELGYEVDIDDKRATPRPIDGVATADMFEAWSPGFRLRPYQIECVNELVAQGGGIVVAGTGAGKTSISAELDAAGVIKIAPLGKMSSPYSKLMDMYKDKTDNTVTVEFSKGLPGSACWFTHHN